MKRVLIYQDYVDHNNNAHILMAVQKLRTNDDVSFCDAEDLLNGCLENNIDLFVIPGGADLYFCEKLNGKPNQIIRKYVEDGGTYLGICAGAYYGCSNIEWAKDNEQSICEPRELSFYNGTGFGPIYNFFEEKDINKSWDQAIELDLWDNTRATTLYRAGPYFSEPTDNNTKVLARYTEIANTPPATLLCTVGKGKAILSAPHIETSPNMYKKMIYKHNNPSYEWQSKVLKKYNKGWSQDKDLLSKILETIL